MKFFFFFFLIFFSTIFLILGKENENNTIHQSKSNNQHKIINQTQQQINNSHNDTSIKFENKKTNHTKKKNRNPILQKMQIKLPNHGLLISTHIMMQMLQIKRYIL